MTYNGGCLCGDIRFEAGAEPVEVVLCHCRTCRRSVGAPFVVWADFPADKVRFVAGAPHVHVSSPGTRRLFCDQCGTSLANTSQHRSEIVSVNVCCLDDPNAIAPLKHIWAGERLAWAGVGDGLPVCDDAGN